MENIRFVYLYRDGGNYKSWAEVVFSNAAGIPHGAAASELRLALAPDGLFIAGQIHFPLDSNPANCHPQCISYGEHVKHMYNSLRI
jgi:hypothetical protein